MFIPDKVQIRTNRNGTCDVRIHTLDVGTANNPGFVTIATGLDLATANTFARNIKEGVNKSFPFREGGMCC